MKLVIYSKIAQFHNFTQCEKLRRFLSKCRPPVLIQRRIWSEDYDYHAPRNCTRFACHAFFSNSMPRQLFGLPHEMRMRVRSETNICTRPSNFGSMCARVCESIIRVFNQTDNNGQHIRTKHPNTHSLILHRCRLYAFTSRRTYPSSRVSFDAVRQTRGSAGPLPCACK